MAKQISTKPISKKRKFVKDGIFYAELNDFLARELAENGYAGCEVRVTPKRTEVTIRATQVLQVVGESGRRIRELTALVQKRFRFPKSGIFMYAEKIPNKGLSALAQAQAVKFRLLQGLSVRRAAYSVVQFIMNKDAKGCEVIVSGKLRGQRAKGMKFKDGYMIHAGDAVNYYIDTAVKHVQLRQGVIGIKVKIMLPYDPDGEKGVSRDLPDSITIPEIIDKGDDDDDDNMAGGDDQQFGGGGPAGGNNDDDMGDDQFGRGPRPDGGSGGGDMNDDNDNNMGGPGPDQSGNNQPSGGDMNDNNDNNMGGTGMMTGDNNNNDNTGFMGDNGNTYQGGPPQSGAPPQSGGYNPQSGFQNNFQNQGFGGSGF